MDARAEAGAIPLAVDLDGTLIASDLLWEGLFLLLRQKPHCLFLLPFWLAAGKARLKCEIANRVAFDAAALPYREAVLDRLKAEKATGRKLVLATAAPRPFAEAVALHLGIFDAVMCTEPGSNLSSTRKRDALIADYGDGGFDYVGNSKDDLAVFDAARASIFAPVQAAYEFYQVEARRGQNQVDAIEDELRDPELSDERKQTLRVALAALRARQAAAYERLQAESALAQLKMIDWSATR